MTLEGRPYSAKALERQGENIDGINEQTLTDSLDQAKSWCRDNLNELMDVPSGFDFNIFNFEIDNTMIGSDVAVHPDVIGLFRVSVRKLEFMQRREETFETGVAVDPQSIFVHMIARHVIESRPIPFIDQEVVQRRIIGKVGARFIENMNRVQRGLKPWTVD